MSKVKITVFILLLIAALSATAYKLYNRQQTGITATGTIEVTRADITSKVAGYITKLSIKEGDRVQNGQIVLYVARPDLKAQLLRDELALTKAEVQLTDLVKGSRSQEINDYEAVVGSARSTFEKAKSDLVRYQALFQQGAISAQQMAAAQSAYEVADSSLKSATAKLQLAIEGNRPDTIEAQRLEVERSKAIVESSRTQVADTVIFSPLDGLVLTKNFEDGEYVNPGSPIATIGNMNDCWVKIYVSSAELGAISVGQTAEVSIDSFPGKVFTGTIKEISQNAEFTPRQSITKRERANLVFQVKVQLDNQDGVLKPGMPADVVIK